MEKRVDVGPAYTAVVDNMGSTGSGGWGSDGRDFGRKIVVVL